MWDDLLRAMTRRSQACPRCGADSVHASSHAYGPLVALLGLRAYRCERCRRRFPIRVWPRRRRLTVARPPEFWPPEIWPREDWVMPPANGADASVHEVGGALFRRASEPAPERRVRDRRTSAQAWAGSERRQAQRRCAPTVDGH